MRLEQAVIDHILFRLVNCRNQEKLIFLLRHRFTQTVKIIPQQIRPAYDMVERRFRSCQISQLLRHQRKIIHVVVCTDKALSGDDLANFTDRDAVADLLVILEGLAVRRQIVQGFIVADLFVREYQGLSDSP